MQNPFTTILEKTHTKDVTLSIVKAIIADPKLAKYLMECFFSDDYRMCQRAACVVEILAEKHPLILKKYVPIMYQNAFEKPKHDAILRNTLRAFQYMHFDEELEGKIFNFCFENATNLRQPIAIRAFGLKICIQMAVKYPDLKNEVTGLLDLISIDEAPGIISMAKFGKKILKMEGRNPLR